MSLEGDVSSEEDISLHCTMSLGEADAAEVGRVGGVAGRTAAAGGAGACWKSRRGAGGAPEVEGWLAML